MENILFKQSVLALFNQLLAVLDIRSSSIFAVTLSDELSANIEEYLYTNSAILVSFQSGDCKMYRHVQICTDVYRYVQACTGRYRYAQINLDKVQACTGVYRRVQVASSGHIFHFFRLFRTFSKYRYVQACTGVYR